MPRRWDCIACLDILGDSWQHKGFEGTRFCRLTVRAYLNIFTGDMLVERVENNRMNSGQHE